MIAGDAVSAAPNSGSRRLAAPGSRDACPGATVGPHGAQIGPDDLHSPPGDLPKPTTAWLTRALERQMATIRASCSECGDVELTTADPTVAAGDWSALARSAVPVPARSITICRRQRH